MRSSQCLVGSTLALLAASVVATAGVQAPEPESVVGFSPGGARYEVRTLGIREGLSHDVAFTLLQDHLDFLWIGTIDGLNRFDGQEFVTFRHDPDDPLSLSNSSVRGLQEGPDGDLWIRTAVGLDRLDRSTGDFRRYPIDAQQLAIDADGELLVAAARGLLRHDSDTGEFETLLAFPVLEGPASPSGTDLVWGLAVDAEGGVWIGTEAGHLFRLATDGRVRHWRSPWRRLRLLDHRPERLWLGHDGGVGTFAPAAGEFRPAGGIGSPVLAGFVAPDDELWVGGASLARLQRNGPDVTAAPVALEVDSATRIWSMLRGREGIVWLATSRGVRMLDPHTRRFRNYRRDPDRASSLSSDAVVALAPGDGSSLWVGTLGAGLNRLDLRTGRARRYPSGTEGDVGRCGETVWSLARVPGGAIWAGTDRGLCFLSDGGRLQRLGLSGASGIDEPIVFVLAVGVGGELWAGTSAGLYRVDPIGRSATRVSLPRDDRGRVGVEGLTVAADGTLWIGLRGGDVCSRSPGEDAGSCFALGATSRLRGSEGFWSLQPRPDGSLWLAGDRGLFLFEPETGELEPHRALGFLATSVYSATGDAAGGTWLGTGNGLLRIGPAGGGGSDLPAIRHYTADDGLAHDEFNRRAAARLGDGRLALGSMGGVTVFDPEDLRANPHAPGVAITSVERVRRDGSVTVRAHGRDSIQLAHDDTGLVIEFAVITFSRPERAVRAYRLDGVDPEWVRAAGDGPARYPPLRPGTYRFQVRAANADGVWNHTGAAVELVVPPPWWATSWFRVLLGVAVLAAVVAVVRQVSTRRLRRRVRALELDRQIREERERISRDLHDHVGSQVSTMLAGIELAELAARDDAPHDVADVLSSLGDDARRTMTRLRDTVWSLHQDVVTAEELVDQVRQHLREQRQYDRRELEVIAVGDVDLELGAGRALALFRIVQEAVRNALRHGDPSVVQIRVERVGGSLRVEIRDDGTFREPGPAHRGHGLDNMASRARQEGGSFELDTAGDHTVIRVEVPVD